MSWKVGNARPSEPGPKDVSGAALCPFSGITSLQEVHQLELEIMHRNCDECFCRINMCICKYDPEIVFFVA